MDHAPVKLIASNRKAYHDYFVEDKYEAGIELCGTEVKSIRMGKTATPWCLCRSISKAPASSWRWACARARSSTTSGTLPPPGTPSGRWTGPGRTAAVIEKAT